MNFCKAIFCWFEYWTSPQRPIYLHCTCYSIPKTQVLLITMHPYPCPPPHPPRASKLYKYKHAQEDAVVYFELWYRHLLCCFCLHIEEEGRGCEYSGPFVVTNCGTLGAREEKGGGAQKMYSHVNVSHSKWKLALSNEMLQQKQAVCIQTL